MDKKAVSPLIATVLLLAFAVSVATIIVQLDVLKAGCSIYSAKLSEDSGSPSVCYDEQARMLNFFIINKKYPIDGVKISIKADEPFNVKVDKSIDSDAIDKLSVPYDKFRYGTPQFLKITPIYSKGDALVENCYIEYDITELKIC